MYTSQGKIDKAAQSDLLTHYAPLVRRLALRLAARLPASVEVDDLIQAGILGLLDAGSRYQDGHGAKFETFATQRIRGAMLDELRAHDWVPRGLRQSGRKVEEAIRAASQKQGRAPTEPEVAEALGLPLEAYQALLQELQGCQLVYYEDFEAAEGGNSFLDDHAADGEARFGPLEQLVESRLRRQLVAAIEALPERDRLLLSLCYEQELNLREIGAIMEISQSRVCQLHGQAISRLRASLRDAL
ncbi:RNA polymerase sigma factor FliA [Ramlibacter tataouinensis]|uniref:RNA polymerase sigma factor FliA n=1 Tax=Ramlibacter tataouinensis TaxID=94132 RepID=UPI0022F3AB91|nr:RNA polymerase sigma factor FliA [Ramlibacter tataouinensis]WBY00586.1 RNA polymerase sigma factor FliA [Ramlibacter tataouinensis]